MGGMEGLSQYRIAYVGLKPGIHNFHFSIDKQFFTYFDNPLASDGNIEVSVKLDKQHAFFLLEINLSGSMKATCNRCNVWLDFPVDTSYPLVIKFDEHHEEEKDDSNADVIYISRTDSHIELGQLIYEFISLSLPLQRINCDNMNEPKPCDRQVLEKLKSINEQHSGSADPRWDDLLKIKIQ
jgi:uncharacterized metal-binding protein YceD (DUF177 family)